MFCSLIGISPCDIILQDTDNRTVRNLLQLLNNRFDVQTLIDVRAEFDYVLGVLDKMIFDYKERDDRILSKKLNIPSMTSFGVDGIDRNEAEKRLAVAERVFTGNIEVNGEVIAVGSDKAMQLLEALHSKRSRLVSLRDSIAYAEFTDAVFFGRPLTWWANSRSHTWLSVYVSDRIARQDNIQNLRKDATNLLSYVTRGESGESLAIEVPTVLEIEARYAQLSGNAFTDEEKNLAFKFSEALSARDLTSIGTDLLSSLVNAFVHCIISSNQYDADTAVRLERCGLYFMNDAKAEFMIACMADLTLVPEKRVVLKNLETGDSYETILSAIIAACDNSLTPVGAMLTGGDR